MEASEQSVVFVFSVSEKWSGEVRICALQSVRGEIFRIQSGWSGWSRRVLFKFKILTSSSLITVVCFLYFAIWFSLYCFLWGRLCIGVSIGLWRFIQVFLQYLLESLFYTSKWALISLDSFIIIPYCKLSHYKFSCWCGWLKIIVQLLDISAKW